MLSFTLTARIKRRNQICVAFHCLTFSSRFTFHPQNCLIFIHSFIFTRYAPMRVLAFIMKTIFWPDCKASATAYQPIEATIGTFWWQYRRFLGLFPLQRFFIFCWFVVFFWLDFWNIENKTMHININVIKNYLSNLCKN